MKRRAGTPTSEEGIKSLDVAIAPLFAFASTWSLMATVTASGRKRFDSFFRGEMLSCGMDFCNFPRDGLIYDYVFDIEQSKWVAWLDTQEPYEHNAKLTFSEIVIPTKILCAMSSF